MTRDDVIRMAREAGFLIDEDAYKYQPNCIMGTHALIDVELKRFAALVVAAEREACAVAVDRARLRLDGSHGLTHETHHIGNRVVEHCITAIRARGNT